MKKEQNQAVTDYDAFVWKHYIRKPEQIRAKLFVVGDQDGYHSVQEIPYVVVKGGIKQLAEFNTNYLTIDEEGNKLLIANDKFEADFDCIDG